MAMSKKWAKFANSLKLKLAARLVNKDRNRAIKIANEVIANQAGILESATDDFIYNREEQTITGTMIPSRCRT